MDTVTTFFIGGIIDATDIRQQSCGSDELFSAASLMATPKVEKYSKKKLAEIAEQAKIRFFELDEVLDQEERDFWKVRIIALVGSSSTLYSVTFLPFDLKTNQTWFMQKNKTEYPVDGFFAPFSPFIDDAESAKELGVFVSPTEANKVNIIATDEDIAISIADLSYNQTLYNDVDSALKYFLMDTLSGTIGLTFYYHDHLVTRLWMKKSIFQEK